jgi:hypothetical protein
MNTISETYSIRPISEILETIKNRFNKRFNSDIARMMNTTSGAVSTWVKRGIIPYQRLVAFCIKYNIDIAELLTGKLPCERQKVADQIKSNPLYPFLKNAEKTVTINNEKGKTRITLKARLRYIRGFHIKQVLALHKYYGWNMLRALETEVQYFHPEEVRSFPSPSISIPDFTFSSAFEKAFFQITNCNNGTCQFAGRDENGQSHIIMEAVLDN